jgi:D-glycero-D-manno-heptose 1,7-bisphosphate phosphatase
MSTPQHQPEVVTNLAPSLKVMPALCLDFDGTIRRSKSGQTFIRNFEDIELMPGIEKLIWRYRSMGWLIFGISNQAGVAHGFKLPMEIESEMNATKKLFSANPFHLIKWCYHDGKGKIEPYCHRSLGRKPDIGMLYEMEVDSWKNGYIVDWDNSLFVGDRPEDEECAKRAGINFRHIDSFLNEPHTFKI